ncbi:MAG: type II toxin-antitoxin system VapC family toxin [Terriglobales bacterium]
MKLLLDTHVWIWFEAAPDQLSRTAQLRLADPANQLFVSVVSAWEFLLLWGKKRVLPDRDGPDWLRRVLAGSRYQICALTLEAILASGEIQLATRDPADRLLAATARALDLTLLTADRVLLAGRGFSFLRA